MRKSGWSMVYTGDGARCPRTVIVPRFTLLVGAVILLAGLAGIGRGIFVLCSYAHGKLGVYIEEQRNRDCVSKIQFYEKLAQMREREITQLVYFEDKARMKYGLERVSEDVREAGIGGPPGTEESILHSLENVQVQEGSALERRLKALLRKAQLQDSTFSQMADHVQRQHDRWGQYPTMLPARGRITSRYGTRFHPFEKRHMMHEGIDIANEPWTPVFAPADGMVSKVGSGGYFGNVVKLKHGGGYATVYAHLSQAAVVEKQVVRRGELVGYIGSSGRSTGPHLHYEVHRFNRHTDPAKYILPTDQVVD
jgi:murein DD-endopeptidase MepM/ murein hydrolase activator NlpD